MSYKHLTKEELRAKLKEKDRELQSLKEEYSKEFFRLSEELIVSKKVIFDLENGFSQKGT
jgi:hypothetical protein